MKIPTTPPRPLSPAEWAKATGPEVTFSSEALTGMQEYAEYVAAYTHAAALQSAIDEINRAAFPGMPRQAFSR